MAPATEVPVEVRLFGSFEVVVGVSCMPSRITSVPSFTSVSCLEAGNDVGSPSVPG